MASDNMQIIVVVDDIDDDESKQPAEVSPREQQRQSDLLLAKRLQEKENNEQPVVTKANPKKEYEQMKKLPDGKAVLVVQKILELKEKIKADNPNFAPSIDAVSSDDMVFLAKNLLQAQASFIQNGIPANIDIGYHFTNATNLTSIRTNGLMTKNERESQGVTSDRYNGSTYGDGVYTSDSPSKFAKYGDTGLIVARLVGSSSTHPLTGNNENAVLVPQRRMVVLRTSSQCLPMIMFHKTLVSSDQGCSLAEKCRSSLQEILDEIFNQGLAAPSVAMLPATALPPASNSSSTYNYSANHGGGYVAASNAAWLPAGTLPPPSNWTSTYNYSALPAPSNVAMPPATMLPPAPNSNSTYNYSANHGGGFVAASNAAWLPAGTLPPPSSNSTSTSNYSANHGGGFVAASNTAWLPAGTLPPPSNAARTTNFSATAMQQNIGIHPDILNYDAPERLSVGINLIEAFCSVLVSSRHLQSANCVICQDPLGNSQSCVAMKVCYHAFHKDCIEQACKFGSNKCPTCRSTIGTTMGKSPSGSMIVSVDSNLACGGYPNCNSILVSYKMTTGTQKPHHENPGQNHSGKIVTAYLPNNSEGQTLLKRLKFAFLHGLTFTVGTSMTTGATNQCTWSSIHHKTSPHGGAHGFPDVNYFANCNGELDSLGVPPANDLDANGKKWN